MKTPEPLLSPSEIAATIYDSGHVRDRGSAADDLFKSLEQELDHLLSELENLSRSITT
jgi:hypothetical protein